MGYAKQSLAPSHRYTPTIGAPTTASFNTHTI